MKNVAVTPSDTIPVVVGAGATSPNSAGSSSSVGDICSADGGWNGAVNFYTGGTGGSGGGCGGYSGSFQYPGIGGKDGGNGSGGTWNNGKGQGTTTRYFGESTGTLYSTGGCGLAQIGAEGGWYNGNEAANTGNGASAARFAYIIGGSGIAIIRWDDQKS